MDGRLKLSLYDKFLALFGVKITWEWCIVGSCIGKPYWSVQLEKCRNGMPVKAGGFLYVFPFPDEKSARTVLPEMFK